MDTSNKTCILVVEPDASRLRTIRRALETYKLVITLTLHDANAHLDDDSKFDLVLFSDGLGNIPACMRVMRESTKLPILVTTCGVIYANPLVAALDAGADDYVDLLQPEILQAKVRASLRRVRHGLEPMTFPPPFEGAGVRYDFATCELLIDGREVVISPTEHKILGILIQNAPAVIPRLEMVNRVWGKTYFDSDDGGSTNLRTYINYLRGKIETDRHNPKRIITIPGIGYRFALEAR